MPVLTRSAARKLAQQQAAEPRVREATRVRKATQEIVTMTVTPSATGKGTHIRWNYSASSQTAAARPYPPPRSIDAFQDPAERYRNPVSSPGVPITSSSASSILSMDSTDSSNDIVGRALPPVGNYKLFRAQNSTRKNVACVPRPLQRTPAVRLEHVSPLLPEIGAPGTRLTFIKDDMSAEAIAHREHRDHQKAEEISTKYWAELMTSKRERDRYLLGGLELDDEVEGDTPLHGHRAAMRQHRQRLHYTKSWIRNSLSPCPTELISQ
ncbi:hypothetical protein BDQ17DRAFT_1432882 [Cyathus striatus]|nr:hypothetical protein BDQ17DRAFT_1432882 [Cyathus striatus]